MAHRWITGTFILTGLMAVVALSLLSTSWPEARAQTPAKIKSDEEQMREVMVTMSRQLGVTCTACHNTDNFKSSAKPTFQVAKEHMKITQLLIDAGMNGKNGPKADCYMCHRGVLKPDYKEKVSAMLKK